MPWHLRGGLAALLFTFMALAQLRADDPWLWVICYVGAAATGVSLVRRQPVQQWISVVLVVLPAELALMALVFEPRGELAAAATAAEVLTRAAALDALGMLAVAAWATWLAVERPFQPSEELA